MSPDPANSVLTAYSPDYQPVDKRFSQVSDGFSGAKIYRLHTAIGEYCLRGWPRHALPKSRIAGLHRLLSHAHQQGVKVVSVPVPARSGETVVEEAGRLWQLEPWMPGTADFWSNANRARLRSSMEKLAAFHQATRNYRANDSAREWFDYREQAVSPAVRERLLKLRDWQDFKIEALKQRVPHLEGVLLELGVEFSLLFERLANHVASRLQSLADVKFWLQPCLRDIWHDHVLFIGDEVTGLIDASACRGENIATDLARLLGSLLTDDAQEWNFALTEYDRIAGLSSDERRLVQALDQSGALLSAMHWMDRLVLKEGVLANPQPVWERLRILRGRLQRLEETIHGSRWDFIV